jgi:3-oxo-5-alpha-steroid 4-dehydrogenase 1
MRPSAVSRLLKIIYSPLTVGLLSFWCHLSRTIPAGIKSWIVMEIVAPITFSYVYARSPLSPTGASRPALASINPRNILALAFLCHYINRALISPLRTPSRSRSHLIVPLCATIWNLSNGFLLGAYLSSPAAASFLLGAFGRPRFWAGLALWAFGFAGNIYHDEILLNLRRGKNKHEKKEPGSKDSKQHYSIPHGLLFEYVTFPNYFCEWVEWAGFALAAAPVPSFTSRSAWFATMSPPWLFVLAEVLVMFPRAWKGHQWYHRTFPNYPKDRRIVIPYIL